MAFNFDLTITLNAIIEVIIFGGGGIVTITTLRNTVRTLKEEMSTSKQATKDQFDGIRESTSRQFDSVQEELKALGEILVAQARFDERLINFDKRLTSQGRQLDELRRGEGWITARRKAVDGEYDP